MLAETLCGLLLGGAGLYLGYLYLQSLQTDGNLLFLVLSLIVISVAIFLLIRAGKAENTVVTKPASTDKQPLSASPSILQRNNEIAKEWSQTMDNRDRLKLLQISANAEQPQR